MEDIWISWECLKSMQRDDERWLAFYNCGEASGARYNKLLLRLMSSQRHKHVQFIPLPPRKEFTPFPDTIDKDHDKTLPFQHYISHLPLNKEPSSLYRTYQRLIWDMKQLNPSENLSYNFVMTTEWMFLSPRSKDDYIGEEYEIGVNSTGMIGLLLTKSEKESEFLEKTGPLTILSCVGKPWPSSS